MIKYIALLVSAVLVGIDQWIKAWVMGNLAGQPSITVIPNLFRLTYVENRGVAFGLLQGKTWFITVAVCIVLAVALFLLLADKLKGNLLVWTVSLIIAGGAGNLIDRIGRGFVVDYLDFSALFGFPVFNFADCCIVVGTFLLFFAVLRQEQREKKAGQEKPEESVQ